MIARRNSCRLRRHSSVIIPHMNIHALVKLYYYFIHTILNIHSLIITILLINMNMNALVKLLLFYWYHFEYVYILS